MVECPNKDSCEYYSVECRRTKFDYKYCMQYRYPNEKDKPQDDYWRWSNWGFGTLLKPDISRIYHKNKED